MIDSVGLCVVLHGFWIRWLKPLFLLEHGLGARDEVAEIDGARTVIDECCTACPNGDLVPVGKPAAGGWARAGR